MSKSLFASKTFWFNLLALAVTIAGALGYDEFQVDPGTQQLALAIVAAVNILLRLVTDKPVHIMKGKG